MFKRIVALCLCLVFITSTLSGCMLLNISKAKNKKKETTENAVVSEIIDESSSQDESSQENEPEESSSSEESSVVVSIPAWKTAYLKYLENLKRDNYGIDVFSFRLVYVDGDDIPELFISGDCEAAGDEICAYKNGRIVQQHLNRIGGDMYIKKGSLVYNFNGNMGYYYAGVYRLGNNGFTQIFSGSQQEHIEEYIDENGEIDYDFSYKFYINDSSGENEVTEQEFNQAQERVFDFNRAEELYLYDDSRMLSYNQIVQQIKSW